MAYSEIMRCAIIFRFWPCALLLLERCCSSIPTMTDKQAVLDALQRLPENASLEEIAEELRIMAAIRRGRSDIAAGRVKTHEEAQQMLKSWASAWPSK